MGDNCYEEKRILKAAFTIFPGGLHGYCFHFNIVLFLRPFLFAEKFPEKGGAGTKGNPKKYQQKQGEKVLEETDVGRVLREVFVDNCLILEQADLKAETCFPCHPVLIRENKGWEDSMIVCFVLCFPLAFYVNL